MATTQAIEVVMPQMGVSVSEGTITKWLKQEGQPVAADEALLEISTDKVDTEVPSPGEGILQQVLVGEGETVAVGTRLAVIAPYGDGLAFQFRIANTRRNEIIELEAQVLYSAMEPDGRGGVVRKYSRLPLERNKVVFFPLSWTIVHPIDAASPFAGRTREDLAQTSAEVLVLLSGIDETFEQTVHARSSYVTDEIAWNARFKSMYLPTDTRQDVSIDINRLHQIGKLLA